MTTTLGKLLVFVNLFAATALLTWATSLSVNRLDWVDRKTETETVKGEITKLREEIDRTSKAVAEASNGYGVRRAELLGEEQGRAYRKQKFDDRLQAARSGRFNNQLFRTADERLDRRALIDVDREGSPVLDLSGQPLRGVDALQSELSRELAESKRLQEAIAGSRDRFAALSAQIETTDAKIGVQRQIEANLRRQRDSLRDLEVNWDDELRLLRARQKQIEQRLASLKGEL